MDLGETPSFHLPPEPEDPRDLPGLRFVPLPQQLRHLRLREAGRNPGLRKQGLPAAPLPEQFPEQECQGRSPRPDPALSGQSGWHRRE